MTRALPFYNSVRIRSRIKMHLLDLTPQGFRPGSFWSLLFTLRQHSLKEVDVTNEDNNKKDE